MLTSCSMVILFLSRFVKPFYWLGTFLMKRPLLCYTLGKEVCVKFKLERRDRHADSGIC